MLVTVFIIMMRPNLPSWAGDQPQLVPTRDVDITYDVTRPQQPKSRERVRWLASEHLERVDSGGKSISILDRKGGEVTLLIPASRTYRKLDSVARGPMEPEAGTVLKRGAESVIAGLACVDWSWTEETETHTACVTADGVLLRLVIDANMLMQARSVTYGPQRPDLFQVPLGYTPALAPEGETGQ